MAAHSLLFDNQSLQAAFLENLEACTQPYRVVESGAVECEGNAWPEVNAAAHAVRDSCFRWYFSWIDSAAETDSFLAALVKSGLPFQVEHHQGGACSCSLGHTKPSTKPCGKTLRSHEPN